jgi:hypothetical protein
MATANFNTVYDGDIKYSLSPHGAEPGYTRTVDGSVIRTQNYALEGNSRIDTWRSFADFTISLPAGAVVSKVELSVYTDTSLGTVNNKVGRLAALASSYGDAILYGLCGDYTYLTEQNLTVTGWHTLNLGATAVSDLISHPTWFSVVLSLQTENNSLIPGNYVYFRSLEYTGSYAPYLTITYTVPSGSSRGYIY